MNQPRSGGAGTSTTGNVCQRALSNPFKQRAKHQRRIHFEISKYFNCYQPPRANQPRKN